MRTLRTLLLFAVLTTIVDNGYGQTKAIRADRTRSFIEYEMKHALHAWTGKSREVACAAELDASDRITRVAATVRIKSFDSQNSNRDAHMLEVTDALTYPNITFSSKTVTPEPGGYLVKGILSFHGIERPFETRVTEEKKDGWRKITGRFMFLLEDYKIERPTLMLVKTDNEVNIAFECWF